MALTFFDVETPNRMNDRICSIGVIRTDDDLNIEYKQGFLINPEVGFDCHNTKVHGLTAQDVSNAPTFDDVWGKELRHIFQGSVAIAHNAPFDLNVLDKTLFSYGEVLVPTEYLCTLHAAQYSNIPTADYRLPSLCSFFGFDLQAHHNAMADTEACMHVFRELRRQRFVDLFCTSVFEHRDYAAPRTSTMDCNTVSSMTDLYGLTVGIGIDRMILPEELQAYIDWMARNESYRSQPYFSEAFTLIEEVLEDRRITPEEYETVLNFARPFLSATINCKTTSAIQELLGIIRGIEADKRIRPTEAYGLRSWMAAHEELSSDKTYVKVFDTLNAVLEDGTITTSEEQELLCLFDSIINPVTAKESMGIGFEGKRFCLTGDFETGSKKDIEAFIVERGGAVAKDVSRKVDYVVMGDKGSESYAFGNYGTKVKKAMELQDQGYPIQVIQEAALNDAFNTTSGEVT